MPELDRFLEFVKRLEVPLTICAEDRIDTAKLESLVQQLGAPLIDQPRTILLLCGAFFEEQVSLAAQYMLIIGFPVFLLRDLIAAKNSEHSQIHDDRLRQAGTVATTSLQLIYEWAATEYNADRRTILNQFLTFGAPR